MKFFIAFLISSTICLSAICSVECIGPTTATKFVVYLHGMDGVLPSKQELENRSVLQEMAKNLNIKFALPRASERCPTSPQQLCWTWAPRTSADLVSFRNSISMAASDCFPKKEYSVIGFSNGGVAVTALLRLCEKVDFKSAITVGSGGSWFSTDPMLLANCGFKLTALLGSDDHVNQKSVRDLIDHLSSIKAAVTLVEYSGGHKLIYEPLAKLLK